MLNGITMVNYCSESDYEFFILRRLLQLKRETFMSHKTLSSHFLPHQISIERDYRMEFPHSACFSYEINQKKCFVTTHFCENTSPTSNATKSRLR